MWQANLSVCLASDINTIMQGWESKMLVDIIGMFFTLGFCVLMIAIIYFALNKKRDK